MHGGNGDMSDLSRRFVACFVAAFDDAGLPEDPELRQALRAYMQWAVQRFNSYPERPPKVPQGLAVPRWSWEGLQPDT
jgi:hemoglobin